MTEEIIIAGFGGQGVLSMGKILAYSGIMQNQEVSWMPDDLRHVHLCMLFHRRHRALARWCDH